MSDNFGVTRDYSLKGIEKPDEEDNKVDARILSLIGLIICFIGVFVSAVIWIELQTIASAVIALITDAVVIAVFLTRQYVGKSARLRSIIMKCI